MKTSQYGYELIKKFEGLRLTAYKCPAGVLTIGYGHTSAAGPPRVIPGMKIGEDRANEILANDLVEFERGVERLITAPLTQGQFDALVSFAYNVGLGSNDKNSPPGLTRSTLRKRINEGRHDAAPAEFMKWTKAGGKQLDGLVRRRRAEVQLWREMSDMDAVSEPELRAKPDAPKPSRTITQSREANGAAIAGAGAATAVVQEVLPALRNGKDFLSSFSPTAIICIVVIAAAIAIWWFRKQRLEEEGA